MDEMSARVTGSQENSNSLFATGWGGIRAPSHKVGNDYTAPHSLQPWFDCICPSHQYACMPFCHFQGQRSTTDCCNACLSPALRASLRRKRILKANICSA